MKPYVPSMRVAVRESFDEDLSDDMEDDVFIRDGKSIKVGIQNTGYEKFIKNTITHMYIDMCPLFPNRHTKRKD